VENAEPPVENAEPPVENTEPPLEDTEPPLEDEKVPPDGLAPGEEKGLPAEEKKPEPGAGATLLGDQFTLSYQSAGTISAPPMVSIPPAEDGGEQQSSPLPLQNEIMVEVKVSLTPGDVDEVSLAGIGLALGREVFSPTQAKLFSHPYLAPAADVLRFSPHARIICAVGAEESGAESVEQGGEIVELFVSREDRPATIPVTLLFTVAPESGGEAALVLGDQEIPLDLRLNR
jgi:hypothetical protein